MPVQYKDAKGYASLTYVDSQLSTKADNQLATQSEPGLLSAGDKYQIDNMPSPQFLWAATHSRVPIIANGGDSISNSVGKGGGNSFLTQALARLWPGRVKFGDDTVEAFAGTSSVTITDTENKIAVLTYESGHSTTAWFESLLEVGKWLYFPATGAPASWVDRVFKITAFDTVANTVTLSYSHIIPQVQGLPVDYTTQTIKLNMSVDHNVYNIAKGGATSAEILEYTLPMLQSWDPIPDILIFNGGTNDGIYTDTADNVIAFIAAARAYGIKIVAWMPMTPKDGLTDPSIVDQFVRANALVRNYVTNTDGCYLIDATSLFLDPLAAGYEPIGGTTGSYDAVCVDGLHTSTRGAEEFAKVIEPLLNKLSAKRYPRALSYLDEWDATNNLYGNVIGARGVFYGTGGTLNAVGGNAGIAANWTVNSWTVANGTSTPTAPAVSIGTCDYVKNSGYRSQIFDLTGLQADANGKVFELRTQKYSTSLFTDTPDYDGEIVVKINATNISKLDLAISAGGTLSAGGFTNLAADVGAGVKDCSFIAPSTDWVFLYLKRPVHTTTFGSAWDLIFTVSSRSNEPLAGTIEVAHAGIFRVN